MVREHRDPSRGLLIIYVISNKNGEKYAYGGVNDKYECDKPYYGYLISFPSKVISRLLQ